MFKPSTRYGDSLNTYDGLKLIALGTMVVDHFADYFMPDAAAMNAIGRMAFPIFLFLVGYSGSWKVHRDLLLCAVAVAACRVLTHHTLFPLNILFTIAAARLAMSLLAQENVTLLGLIEIFVFSLLLYFVFIWFDYSTFAVLFAVAGYLQRKRPGAISTLIFLYAIVALHFLLQTVIFDFHAHALVIAILVAVAVTCLLQKFTLHPLDTDFLPGPIVRALQWASRNTLPLYTFHVILFMALERLLFPERLLIFHWI
jgi:hypothetical protein